MRITYKGDYALKAILDLSLHYEQGVMTIHELAQQADIPLKFLEQVLLELKRGGFVESRRGKVGGYFLARPPSQIKLGEVIRFIDGPLEPIACVEKRYSGCNDLSSCVFRKIWQRVAEAISGIVDTMTFEDILKQVKIVQEAIVYTI
jgi:Rrf2 family protein